MMQNIDRMKELVERLNQAAKVYYQGQDEIMSNYEYDKLYDELVELEKKTGIIMASSPTVHVGYETISELPKEAHVSPMLSLGKTKEAEDLVSWLGEEEGLLSMKLDGLSVIITYRGGRLEKALTRGNGEIGEVITNNAKTFWNLPAKISYTGSLIIRGEALIRYSDFEELNRSEAEIGEKYKNPRNLCSGSVRQLNNEITAKRRVHYYVYNMIQTDYERNFEKKQDEMEWLSSLGFDVVPYKKVTGQTVVDCVEKFSKEVSESDLPSDGLVLTYDDIAYSATLGRTAKYPRDSIAFKWQDELADTKLKEIEWSASRTGLINPVAIFEPVELEGTTVSRASVHNISILRELKLGIGDEISVYKANMIIPQIYDNKTKTNNCEIPKHCPVCGGETALLQENETTVLVCPNPDCYAKKIKLFNHFVSRDAMNIDGLSESTLEKLINMNLIHSVTDLYSLESEREKIIEIEGFGEKSFENLIQALEQSKRTPLANVLFSLGIKGVGLSTAKLIVKQFPLPLPQYVSLTKEDLVSIDGVGEVLANSFVDFFGKKENYTVVCKLAEILETPLPGQPNTEETLGGRTFVITGSLNHFTNRKECKEAIENLGGKVAGSVSSKTDYLVNNDIQSMSSKNKKAKELGIPIITEEELLSILQA